MSRKAICPGCNSYTSGVQDALDEGNPCPVCGLPADVMAQVHAAQERYAESQLRDELEAALVRAGKAERERDEARAALRGIRRAVANAVERAEGH